jgi:hypothetical protein
MPGHYIATVDADARGVIGGTIVATFVGDVIGVFIVVSAFAVARMRTIAIAVVVAPVLCCPPASDAAVRRKRETRAANSRRQED